MTEPRTCALCGHGILGAYATWRAGQRIAPVHPDCRRQAKDDERIQRKAERRRELEERRIAIIRGDIA